MTYEGRGCQGTRWAEAAFSTRTDPRMPSVTAGVRGSARDDRADLARELGGRGLTLLLLLREGLGRDRVELAIGTAERTRRLTDDQAHGLGDVQVAQVVWQLVAHDLVEDDAEAVDVR